MHKGRGLPLLEVKKSSLKLYPPMLLWWGQGVSGTCSRWAGRLQKVLRALTHDLRNVQPGGTQHHRCVLSTHARLEHSKLNVCTRIHHEPAGTASVDTNGLRKRDSFEWEMNTLTHKSDDFNKLSHHVICYIPACISLTKCFVWITSRCIIPIPASISWMCPMLLLYTSLKPRSPHYVTTTICNTLNLAPYLYFTNFIHCK